MSQLSFHAPACVCPAPCLSCRSLSLSGALTDASQKRLGRTVGFTQAHYVLQTAYDAAGLLAGSTLLAPALGLGADLKLDPLNARIERNMQVLEALRRAGGGTVRAALATHFFGFAQLTDVLRRLCAAPGTMLIEDCKHLSPSLHGSSGLGRSGVDAVGSTNKYSAAEMAWMRQQLAAALPTRGGASA